MTNLFKTTEIIRILVIALCFLIQIKYSNASVSGIKSYIANGELAEVSGGAFGSSSVFYLGDAEKWANCTKTTQQQISGNISWNGPNSIILNTTDFVAGEKAYLFHANGFEALDGEIPGYPVVIEKPNISKCTNYYTSDGVYHMLLEGSGFVYNSNIAKVYLGSNNIWENNTVRIEQPIDSWDLGEINTQVVMGELESLDYFYLYVVDGDGEVSNSCLIKKVTKPNITNVVGRINNGESLSISGNYFGNKSVAQPILWDNFESGQVSGDWDWVDNNIWSVYSGPGQVDNSQYALRADRSLVDSVNLAKNLDSGPGDFLYTFVKRRWDYSFSDKNQKFFRYWQSSGSQSIAWSGLFYDNPNPNWSYMMRDSYTRHSKYSFGDWYYQAIPETFPNNDGLWRTEEFFAKLESGVDKCDGIMAYRVNNNLHRKLVDDRCMWTNDNINYPFRRIHIDNYGQCRLTGENACPLDDDQCCFSVGDYIWVDDVYIDNTWSRVVVGNRPNYDDCDHIEIQPAITWSDNSITIEFNQGAFSANDTAYVFVINADNVASTGYPVVIGNYSFVNHRYDVNQDNQINTTDALLTLRKSLGLDMSNTNWNNSSTETGDVNCNNATNSTDAMLILRKSLGLNMETTDWCVN